MSEAFTYSYSAERQKEIEEIRKKYLPHGEQEDKMTMLRRLDADTSRPGLIAALTLGILGILVFGTGMCCFLVWNRFIAGVLLCLTGVAAMGVAPLVRRRITENQKAKMAPQILRLTEELSQSG